MLYIFYLTIPISESHMILNPCLVNSTHLTPWSLFLWVLGHFLWWVYIWLNIICRDPESLNWRCFLPGTIYVCFFSVAELLPRWAGTLGSIQRFRAYSRSLSFISPILQRAQGFVPWFQGWYSCHLSLSHLLTIPILLSF